MASKIGRREHPTTGSRARIDALRATDQQGGRTVRVPTDDRAKPPRAKVAAPVATEQESLVHMRSIALAASEYTKGKP